MNKLNAGPKSEQKEISAAKEKIERMEQANQSFENRKSLFFSTGAYSKYLKLPFLLSETT